MRLSNKLLVIEQANLQIQTVVCLALTCLHAAKRVAATCCGPCLTYNIVLPKWLQQFKHSLVSGADPLFTASVCAHAFEPENIVPVAAILAAKAQCVQRT